MSNSKIFIKSDDINWESVGNGLTRQILCYDSELMMTRVVFEKGAVGAPHHHPHRQVSYVEKGTFEVDIAGEKSILKTGDSFFVPPDKVHGVVALEDSALVDVFTPYREEFLTNE